MRFDGWIVVEITEKVKAHDVDGDKEVHEYPSCIDNEPFLRRDLKPVAEQLGLIIEYIPFDLLTVRSMIELVSRYQEEDKDTETFARDNGDCIILKKASYYIPQEAD